jgi:hypothetical protein
VTQYNIVTKLGIPLHLHACIERISFHFRESLSAFNSQERDTLPLRVELEEIVLTFCSAKLACFVVV